MDPRGRTALASESLAPPKRLSEHAFDKLRLLDCTIAEFDELLTLADIIEEHRLEGGELKELLLLLDWRLPLHVVVVVDDGRRGSV